MVALRLSREFQSWRYTTSVGFMVEGCPAEAWPDGGILTSGASRGSDAGSAVGRSSRYTMPIAAFACIGEAIALWREVRVTIRPFAVILLRRESDGSDPPSRDGRSPPCRFVARANGAALCRFGLSDPRQRSALPSVRLYRELLNSKS